MVWTKWRNICHSKRWWCRGHYFSLSIMRVWFWPGAHTRKIRKTTRTRDSEKYCNVRAAIETKRSAVGFKAQLTKSLFVFIQLWSKFGGILDVPAHDAAAWRLYWLPASSLSTFWFFVPVYWSLLQTWQTKKDGLNVENMNKEFGGAQQKLCNTTIKKQQGYLGSHSSILKPGDIQSMVFKSGDVGPFWMTC